MQPVFKKNYSWKPECCKTSKMCFPISDFPLAFLLPSLLGDQSYLLFSPHYGQKVVSFKYSHVSYSFSHTDREDDTWSDCIYKFWDEWLGTDSDQLCPGNIIILYKYSYWKLYIWETVKGNDVLELTHNDLQEPIVIFFRNFASWLLNTGIIKS